MSQDVREPTLGEMLRDFRAKQVTVIGAIQTVKRESPIPELLPVLKDVEDEVKNEAVGVDKLIARLCPFCDNGIRVRQNGELVCPTCQVNERAEFLGHTAHRFEL